MVLLSLISSNHVFADPVKDLKIYMDNFPPLNFVGEDGRLQGISVDLLLEMFSRLGSTKTIKDIDVVPWARGYKFALTQNNTVLFTMMRTPAREKMFKWVGPIISSSHVLIAKKKNSIQLSPSSSKADMNRYRYVVIRNDAGYQLLLERGIETNNLDNVNSAKLAIKLLQHENRSQIWANNKIAAFWMLKKLGIDAAEYEVVDTLKYGESYFALHKETDDESVKMLQRAFDGIKADGILKKIINKYLPGYE